MSLRLSPSLGGKSHGLNLHGIDTGKSTHAVLIKRHGSTVGST